MIEFDNLINEKNKLEIEIEDINSYIKQNNKEKIKSFFFDGNYYTKRKIYYGEILKDERNNKETRLNQIELVLDKYSTFSFNLFTLFLSDIISIMEGETFIKMNFDFRKNSTCLIASYENIKKIRRKHYPQPYFPYMNSSNILLCHSNILLNSSISGFLLSENIKIKELLNSHFLFFIFVMKIFKLKKLIKKNNN